MPAIPGGVTGEIGETRLKLNLGGLFKFSALSWEGVRATHSRFGWIPTPPFPGRSCGMGMLLTWAGQSGFGLCAEGGAGRDILSRVALRDFP